MHGWDWHRQSLHLPAIVLLFAIRLNNIPSPAESVLDPNSAEFRAEAKRKLLIGRAAAPDDVRLWVRSEVGLRGIVKIPGLLGKSRFSSTEISDALLDLQRHKEIVIHEKIAANPSNWRALRDRATHLIDDALSKNPERVGYNLSDLRAALRDKPTDVFEALMADLYSSDFIRKESTITRRSHRPALPGNLQPLAEKIHEYLSRKPFDPPPRRELEGEPEEATSAQIFDGDRKGD